MSQNKMSQIICKCDNCNTTETNTVPMYLKIWLVVFILRQFI